MTRSVIRELQQSDISQVMRIWLNGNTEAHPFVSREYWVSNFDMVKQQLASAEVYVAETNGQIQGFIGLMDTYIAGIFVDQTCRSQGVGRQLLACAKEKHDALTLSVYRENRRAVSFYLREGFQISASGVDEETGQQEYTMCFAHGMA